MSDRDSSDDEAEKEEEEEAVKAEEEADFGWSPYLERFHQFWWDEDRRFFVTFTRYVPGVRDWSAEDRESSEEEEEEELYAPSYGSSEDEEEDEDEEEGATAGSAEEGEDPEATKEADEGAAAGSAKEEEEDVPRAAIKTASSLGGVHTGGASMLLSEVDHGESEAPSGIFRVVVPHGGGVNPRAAFDLPSDIFHTYERDVRGCRFSQCLRLCAVLRSGTTVDVMVRRAHPNQNSLIGSIKCGKLGIGNLFLTDGMIWGPSRRRDVHHFGNIELALVGMMETVICEVSGPIDGPELIPLRRIPSAHVENFWTQNVVRAKPSRGLILWLATIGESSSGHAAETTVKIVLAAASSSTIRGDDPVGRRRGPAACVNNFLGRIFRG